MEELPRLGQSCLYHLTNCGKTAFCVDGEISMERNTAIITINLFKKEYTHDLEVPLDISVNELCSVMNELWKLK